METRKLALPAALQRRLDAHEAQGGQVVRLHQQHRPLVGLKPARTKRGVLVAELAISAGISAALVMEIESGRHVPSPYTTRLLARALGTTAEALAEKQPVGAR